MVTGLGVPVGVLLARSRFAARLLSPYIVAAQAMPILARGETIADLIAIIGSVDYILPDIDR